MSPALQWLFPLAAVLVGLGYLGFRQQDLEAVVPVTWASYVSFAVTNFLGASVFYWLLVAPHLLRVMIRQGPLNLRWYDPSSTPGIRLFADALSRAGVFLLYAAGGVTLLAFLIDRDGGLLPSSIVNLLFLLTGLVLATGIRVVLPFYLAYTEVTAAKRAVQVELEKTIHWKPGAGGPPSAEEERAITLHDQIASAPNLPFSTASVVQYVAVGVGSVLGYVSALLTK